MTLRFHHYVEVSRKFAMVSPLSRVSIDIAFDCASAPTCLSLNLFPPHFISASIIYYSWRVIMMILSMFHETCTHHYDTVSIADGCTISHFSKVCGRERPITTLDGDFDSVSCFLLAFSLAVSLYDT